jgi:glycosyltransferase involved in cell wall biosynthesis
MVNYPLVSVIMPVYNGERFLREALESIRHQNYEPLEIIVVDDGSTDNTAKIIASYGNWIRYVRQENAGPAAARNRGLALAGGKLVAFLDADDLWPEGKLALQVERLINDPKLDIVLGRIQYVELPGAAHVEIPFESSEKTLTGIHLGCGIYRKSVFDKVGGFDETLRISEDQDWFLRAREVNISVVILKETTLIYRLHSNNLTRNFTFRDSRLGIVIRKSLERRRKLGLGKLRQWSYYDEAKKVPPAGNKEENPKE